MDGATNQLPKITVVTVCYNHAAYVEQTLQSVIHQNYPALEYIVVDGASTDGSVDIINRYSAHLASWTSERDKGQYDALNKGFQRSTGEILCWINSDDFLLPNALSTVASIFQQLPEVQWLTTRTIVHCDEWGRMSWGRMKGVSRQAWGEDPASQWIMQEGTFWRRSLFERASGLAIPSRFSHSADLDLWNRFFRESDVHVTDVPLACARLSPLQRSRQSVSAAQTAEVRAEATQQWGQSWGRHLRKALVTCRANRLPGFARFGAKAFGVPIRVLKRPIDPATGIATSPSWFVDVEYVI